MKTLQIVGSSPYGGGAYLLVQWCRYLVARGWQVDVLATHPGIAAELAPPVRVLGDIAIPRTVAPLRSAVALLRIARLVARERYDVVHTYTTVPGFVGRLAARLASTPIVLHHHASWPVTERSGRLAQLLLTPLERLAVHAATLSICVSDATHRVSRAHGCRADRLTIVKNGIDPQPFLTASGDGVRAELGAAPDRLLVGSTIRLAPDKDAESLLRALAVGEWTGRRPLLVIAGDGPEHARLEALAARLGIGDDVRLLGHRRDVPQLLSALDVFVQPSLREGLSVSLLEAMASAKPIVATAIAANAELIEHERTGLLVGPRAPAELAVAIARLAADRALAGRCAAAARALVLADYTLDRMLAETLSLYASPRAAV